MRRLIVVLGIPIDLLNLDGALERIGLLVQTGRNTGRGHQVATVNVDFVVQALFDPELRYLLQQADLLTADGMPLVWASRNLGAGLEGRVTGADLVPALAHYAAEHGLSMYFLGGAPGVAARAAEILRTKNPNLRIAGVTSPPFASILEMDTSFLDDIRHKKPDILLVAFGSPKQEKWIGMYGSSLGVPVMIGVGGSLDFIAGVTRRAPAWMQDAGLEWLHRLLHEPRRLFRRYGKDLLIFGFAYLRQALAMHPLAIFRQQKPVITLTVNKGKSFLLLRGWLTRNVLDNLESAGQQALAMNAPIFINLSRAVFLDSSVYGWLVEFKNRARRSGRQVYLVAASTRVRRALALLKLDKMFPPVTDGEPSLEDTVFQPYVARPCPGSNLRWAVLKSSRVLDASNAQQFFEAGLSALGQNPFLICDFSTTVFLSSAGLVALSRLHDAAVRMHGELKLINCCDDVLKVVKMAHFDRLLPVYSSYSQAVASAATV